MSRKTVTIVAAGLLVAAGAVTAMSQTMSGRGGGWMGGRHGQGDDLSGGFGGHFRHALTKDEFDTRTRERFARFDKNNDGVIDATEVEAAFGARINERGGGRMGSGRGQRMLRVFDANRDGKVTKDEYVAGVRKMFAEVDLNNDGRITDDDLPPMMRGRNVLSGAGRSGMEHRGHGMGGMRLLMLLRDADTNKDGVVTLDEAMAAAEKRFATLDRNKDGAIDAADFDAMRKEMVDYRVKRFIHHFGADRDGKITREQFTAKASERFALMDINGDGTVSRDEMPGRGRGQVMMGRTRGHDMDMGDGGGRRHGRMMGRDGDGERLAPPPPVPASPEKK